MTRVRLWDLPVRVFHWSLVAAVTTAIVTAKLGGDWMTVHGKAGLTIVGLVVFRLVWGVVGSRHARFASFAPTPAKLRAYLKGQWHGLGHNPLGAFSVFALLGLLEAQATTGLFSNDDISFTGPLFDLVNENLAGQLTGWHRQFATALYVLLGLHVAAIAFYARVKKDNLVKPMVTGWKDVADAPIDAVAESRAGLVRAAAFIAALAVALAAVYIATGTPFKKAPAAPAPAQQTTGAEAGAGNTATATTTGSTTSNSTPSTKPAAPAW
jgi:cytochrome b